MPQAMFSPPSSLSMSFLFLPSFQASRKPLNINILGGRCPGQTGAVSGTNWHPSLGQSGRFLLNSTVASPSCAVCPSDGWGVRSWDNCPARTVRTMFMCFVFIGFLFRPQKNYYGPKSITHLYDLRINFPIAQDICYTGLSGRNSFV